MASKCDDDDDEMIYRITDDGIVIVHASNMIFHVNQEGDIISIEEVMEQEDDNDDEEMIQEDDDEEDMEQDGGGGGDGSGGSGLPYTIETVSQRKIAKFNVQGYEYKVTIAEMNNLNYLEAVQVLHNTLSGKKLFMTMLQK